MKLSLYQRVALRRDLDSYRLKKGDVAMLIDYVPSPDKGEDGYVLEIFNALGESLLVATVRISDVEPLQADEVLSVRPLAKVS